MECYWCLCWLVQENVCIVEVVVFKDEILCLVEILLVLCMLGLLQLVCGLQVKLDLLCWDEVDLIVEVCLLEVLIVVVQVLVSDFGEDDDELFEGMVFMGSEEQGEEVVVEQNLVQNNVQNNVQNDEQDFLQENVQEELYFYVVDVDENLLV